MSWDKHTAIIADDLETHGWWTTLLPELMPDLLPLAQARRQAVGLLCQRGFLAGVGRQHRHLVETSIRGDRICWIEPELDGPLGAWLASVEALAEALREEMRLPLREVEMLVSRYARGAAYARHIDQHRGVGARLFTVILYLNPNWRPAHGGCLRLWADNGEHQIAPQAGRMVIMRADIPHAVEASLQSRYAITAWLRRQAAF